MFFGLVSPLLSQPLSVRITTLTLDHSGGAIIIGGPALTYYVQPTEEELFKRYNPDLQKKSLANREQRQREFDEFVTNLKAQSKSDKSSKYHQNLEMLVRFENNHLLTSAQYGLCKLRHKRKKRR